MANKVKTFRKVRYRNVYQGVDLVYYGNYRQLEFDFELEPGADPRMIRLHFDGARRLKLNRDGDLEVVVRGGRLNFRKPTLYQLSAANERVSIAGSYVIKGKDVSFSVRHFDSSRPLVIDPVLSYSTYLGGEGNEAALGIAVDSNGSAYVTGQTNSLNFPTTSGAFRRSGDFRTDAFVSKLDPTGTALVYSTYLGGTDRDIANGIAIDASGHAFVTGYTFSPDFPSVNAIRGVYNFLNTIDDGSTWSGQFIGTTDIRDLVLDPQTPSTIYAASPGGGGVFKSIDGGNNWIPLNTGLSSTAAVALAIDPLTPSTIYAAIYSPFTGIIKSTNSGATWSSIPISIGGIYTLAIDPVTPSTLYLGSNSGILKSTNAGATWTNVNNNFAPFTIGIDPATPSTIYAASFGVIKSTDGGLHWTAANTGLPPTNILSLAIDPVDPTTVYVGTNAGGIFKSTNGGGNWNSAAIGIPNETATALAVSPANRNVVYAGTTIGKIFRTADGGNSWTLVHEAAQGVRFERIRIIPGASSTVYAGASLGNSIESEAFVTKLNPTGSALVYSTLLGGTRSDFGNSVAVDASGNAYITGTTTSEDFLRSNASQPTLRGGLDAFVTKMNSTGSALVYSTYLGGTRSEDGYGIAVDSTGNAYVTGSTTSTDFPLANPFQAVKGDSFTTDTFVTKFTASGARAYSTYLGGNVGDTGYAIAVDSDGNAYVTGQTSSSTFPLKNPIQTTTDQYGDVFVTKLSQTGNALVYSTFLGGSATDAGRGIAVDSTGSAYVTGSTSSSNFPTVGSFKNKGGLFVSTDGGATWSNDNITGLSSASIRKLVVDPSAPWIIYAAPDTGMIQSIDRGRHWEPINNGLVNATVSAIVVDPKTPSTIYAGLAFRDFANSSGVYKSTNGGASWTAINNGLPTTDVLSLAVDPVTPSTLYSGVYGRGIFKSTDSGEHWSPKNTNLTGSFVAAIIVDPVTPSTIYVGSIFSSGGVFKSTNGGDSWNPVNNGVTTTEVQNLILDPAFHDTLYAGTASGVFKTTNGGASWALSLNKPFSYALAIDPTSSSTVYAGSFANGAFKTTDGGNNWAPVNNGLVTSSVNTLAISPGAPQKILIGASGSSAFDDDAFVTRLNAAGTGFIYSTYLGGRSSGPNGDTSNDGGNAIAVDNSGNAYVAGFARSKDFPVTTGAYQPTNSGFDDTFVSKIGTQTPQLQFSANQYDVSEGGVATIDVSLSGDFDGTVSVDYRTDDNTAMQKSDYTVSSGTLTFTSGEKRKTFIIPITDDSYVEGTESVALSIGNPSGNFSLGTPATATLLIHDNDSETPVTNPIDNAQFFVRQHYYDFLSRLPDQGGLDYWTSQITGCDNDPVCVNSRRVGVSAAYFIELEFQDTGSFVYRFYKASYGGRPTYAQFMPDRSRIVDGPNLEAGKQAFADSWVRRPEFPSKYPTNLTGPQFVDALLLTVQQGSGLDLSSQRQALIDDFNVHQSRTRILRLIVDNATFKDIEYNRAFVLMQYFGYLRRDPDEGGYQFWLDVLNNRVPGNFRGMVCAFLTSAEYQSRFSSVRTRTDSVCAEIQ